MEIHEIPQAIRELEQTIAQKVREIDALRQHTTASARPQRSPLARPSSSASSADASEIVTEIDYDEYQALVEKAQRYDAIVGASGALPASASPPQPASTARPAVIQPPTRPDGPMDQWSDADLRQYVEAWDAYIASNQKRPPMTSTHLWSDAEDWRARHAV